MIEKQVLFIFLLPIWIVIRIVFWRVFKGRRNSIKRELILNVFFIYILCLLSVTLFPLYITFGRDNHWFSVNIIPVISTVKEVSNITNDPNMHNFMVRFWIKNILGNVLLLMPLGVMLPMLWRKFQGARKTVVFAFCLSLSIEIIQLLSSYIGNVGRAFDIDDIILNTIGAWLGFILYDKFIRKVVIKYKSKAASIV